MRDRLRRPTRGRRGRWLVAVGIVVVVIVGFVVAGLARLGVDTGVESFVPPGDPTTKATNEVASSFGGDPIVVLLESRKPYDLMSAEQLPNLLRLEGNLAGMRDVSTLYGPATVLNQIAGQAQSLLAELVGYRDGLREKAEQAASNDGKPKAAIAAAGRKATAPFDERYSNLLAQGLPGGLPTLRNQKFVHSVVFNEAGQPRAQWDFVVPSEDAVAILVRPDENLGQDAVEKLVRQVDRTVQKSGLKTEQVTVSGVPAVVSALGVQVRQEVPLLGGLALIGVGAWFLGTRWTRRRWRLLPLAATLTGTAITLALAGWLSIEVSLGVVAFLPVLLGVGSDFMTYLHRRAGRRVVVSAATATAASFAALVVAPIPAVQELGLTLAVGTLVTLAVSLSLHWVLEFDASTAHAEAIGTRVILKRPARGMRLAAWAVAVLIAGGGWATLPHLPISANFQSLASDLPVFDDAKHVEDIMGSSGEVVVSLSGKDTVTTESLAWMEKAQGKLVAAHGDKLRPILSPASLFQFLGSSPSADELDAALRLLPRYLSTSVMRGDKRMSIMSFGVRLDDARELEKLRADIVRILPPPPAGVEVRVAGLPMVAVAGYQALSTDQYLTAGLGIVAAGFVLLLGLRRRGDALLAMLAAALTTGFVLLGMEITGIGLNPITAAVGSLAAAVACEFTVVMAEAVRRRDLGIVHAVTLAAAASSTGYGVLALSDLSIIRNFGMLLAVTVACALGSARLVVWLAIEVAVGQPNTAESDHFTTAKQLVGANR